MHSQKILISAVVLFGLILAAFFLGKSAGSRMVGSGYGPETASLDQVIDIKRPEGFLVLVIDDLGYSLNNLDRIKGLGVPVTLAVLPDLRYSGRVSEMSRTGLAEVILHLPMEPALTDWPREQNTVMAGMAGKEVDDILRDALISVPGASGVSNHMGSRATADETAAKALMAALKKRGLFFLDSFTSADSVCEKAANSAGVPYFRRDFFIDNEPQKSAIKHRLMEAGKTAVKDGSAIAIGHDREITIVAVSEVIPLLQEMGICFISLKELAAKSSG